MLHCLLFFFVFIRKFFICFLSRISTSFLRVRVGCRAIWDYEFDMHSNVTILRDVVWLPAGSMGYWPIKSRHFYQTGDKQFSCHIIKILITLSHLFCCLIDNASIIRNGCWVSCVQSSEEFEDTKGVIRIRKSKNRQHNLQKKKYKRTNNDLQNIHIKLKMELHECLNPDLTTIRDFVKGYRLFTTTTKWKKIQQTSHFN